MNRSRCLAFLLVLCLAPFSAAQDAHYRPILNAKDVEATLGTSWYGVYLKDKKIGYCKIGSERDGGTILESMTINMKLVSFNKKAEVKISQTMLFEAKEPYRLLQGGFDADDGGSTTKITAKRKDKGFEYTIVAAGQKRTKEVAELDYTLADSIGSEVWLRTRPQVGDKILVRSLDIEDWKNDELTHTMKAIKTSLVGGVDVKFHEVESRSKKTMISYLSRHDDKGKVLSSHIAIFELRRETEEQAKNTEFSADIFVLGMAKLDRGVGHTTKLTELVLEVDGKEGDFLKNGPRQTVVEQAGKGRLIKIGKKHGVEAKATAAELKENLEETNAYAISNAKIKALAKEAIGDANTDEEKVRRIVAFAYRTIKPEMIATLPNIHDLIEKKSGDCKCYSLFVANLSRAAGVSCREVAGLVYMGDDAKAFGGHAWNEVVIGGVWVPIDATLNQMELDAGHISFGEMRSATSAILQSAGKLSFRAVAWTSK